MFTSLQIQYILKTYTLKWPSQIKYSAVCTQGISWNMIAVNWVFKPQHIGLHALLFTELKYFKTRYSAMISIMNYQVKTEYWKMKFSVVDFTQSQHRYVGPYLFLWIYFAPWAKTSHKLLEGNPSYTKVSCYRGPDQRQVTLSILRNSRFCGCLSGGVLVVAFVLWKYSESCSVINKLSNWSHLKVTSFIQECSLEAKKKVKTHIM